MRRCRWLEAEVGIELEEKESVMCSCVKMWPRHFKAVAKAHDVEPSYWENRMGKPLVYQGHYRKCMKFSQNKYNQYPDLRLHWRPMVETAVRVVFEFVLMASTVSYRRSHRYLTHIS